MEAGQVKQDLLQKMESGIGNSVARVVLSALGGIPVAGSFIGAAGTAWSEHDYRKFQQILISWLQVQDEEITAIGRTLAEVLLRVDQENELVKARLQSPEYLSLIKRCFREWSAAESEEKKELIKNLLVHAAAVEQLCPDDVIKMFIQWIDTYNDSHFKIIREIYREPGITRFEIWKRIHKIEVREDSAEADLFKLLIHELTLGMIIRQYREKDDNGNFIKQSRKTPVRSSSLMKSAFDDDKEYHLTELGQWFVHYTMNGDTKKPETKCEDSKPSR